MATARLIDPFAGRDDVATALLGVRGMDHVERLAAHSGGGHPQRSVLVGDTALTHEHFDELKSRAEVIATEHHEQHPLRTGIPLATLSATLGTSPELAELLVERSDRIVRSGPDVSTRQHRSSLDPDSRLRWENARARLGEGLAVPDVDDWVWADELIHLMLREIGLVRVPTPRLSARADRRDQDECWVR